MLGANPSFYFGSGAVTNFQVAMIAINCVCYPFVATMINIRYGDRTTIRWISSIYRSLTYYVFLGINHDDPADSIIPLPCLMRAVLAVGEGLTSSANLLFQATV